MIERYTLPKMREIWSENAKCRRWLEVELAVCEGWAKLGKIPEEALRKIKNKAKFSALRAKEIEKEVGHDFIAFLTSVAENVGKESRFIHMGLTSYDVEDTALALRMRESAKIISQDIVDLIRILRKRAKEHKDTIMMGRSHGVHAEPITFGLKLAVWIAEMERNLERIEEMIARLSVGKISGAVGTYANIDPRVEDHALKRLGLKKDEASTQVIARDRHSEYLGVLAIVAASLEKYATEIRNLQRTELLEVEEPFGRKQKGSSAMPHKKNPILSERVSGLARVVRANAMAGLENCALWHERDIAHSSAERIILPDSSILVDYMLQTFSKVMAGLVVYKENMKKNIEKTGGLIFSERILHKLIDKGLTREQAYTIVQTDAMKSRAVGRPYRDVVLSDPLIKKHLTAKEINDAFELSYFIRNVDVIYKRLDI
ncbi:MAG: adenylosuccinate lyase [Candidatus Saganbacteria bacterium]|nr:adenylosuccinate lyase [Candidatus Saganbacteria bacterium]